MTLAAAILRPDPHRMQGVYYRHDTRSPWHFLGKTKSVIAAETKMARKAREAGVGVLVYLEAPNFLDMVDSLRMLGRGTRLLARRPAKSFLENYERSIEQGRVKWKKVNVQQLKLPFGGQAKRVTR